MIDFEWEENWWVLERWLYWCNRFVSGLILFLIEMMWVICWVWFEFGGISGLFGSLLMLDMVFVCFVDVFVLVWWFGNVWYLSNVERWLFMKFVILLFFI